MYRLFSFLFIQVLRALFFSVVKCVTQSIAGYKGVLSVSSDGGTTYNPVGELTDVDITFTQKMLDATSHSSAGAEEYVPGTSGWVATAKTLAVYSDTAQAAVIAALTPKTKLFFRFDPVGTSVGLPRRVGAGFIESFKEASPNTNLVAIDISIRGTGVLTFSTQ